MTSKQRLVKHMAEVHGVGSANDSKAELQRLHGKLRKDTGCKWQVKPT